MRIETENGYIEKLPNPTMGIIKFLVQGAHEYTVITLTLRQLTLLRENFNDIIDYLQESNEADDCD